MSKGNSVRPSVLGSKIWGRLKLFSWTEMITVRALQPLPIQASLLIVSLLAYWHGSDFTFVF